jgi:biopolymer transport protein ExbD
MRKYRIKKADLDMNLAPLIDIVFLLLIFFMVASTLNINEVKATIQLPETETVNEMSGDAIVLYINREGQIFIEEESVQWMELPGILQDWMNQDNTNQVTVYADKEVDFQYIIKMLDLGNQLNIDQMQFSLSRH